MKRTSTWRSMRLCAAALPILLAACAGSIPKPEFNHELASQYRINKDDQPQVKVDTGPGVVLLDLDKQRIGEVIASKLDQRRVLNSAAGNPQACVVDVTVTRYQRGNAFARAMLAGLGQIHIDANVHVTATADQHVLDDFKIAKTFAWGGIYGASTSMEDIERTFADGVAAALTGQETEKDPSVNKKPR